MSATFIFLITASLYSSSAELITDSMSRLQKYDLKIVPPANIQATKNVRSLSHCAAICNRNKQSCLSIQYQAEASLCRLVSVRLNDEEVLEEPGSSGWKYYERNMECFDWHIFNGHAYQLDITTRNFTSAQQQDIVTSNRKSGLICMTASTRNRTLGWRAGSRPSTPTGPRTPRQTLKRSAARFLRRLGGPGMTSYVSC
nr:uncharacterized protein LOC105340376 isoform X2 [Crassostrea gigas]